METLTAIPAAVAAIIPAAQLAATRSNLQAYSVEIERIEALLKICPRLGETDGMKEHPVVFHYFFGGTDIYICEYSPEARLMFGYTILCGDLENSEFGYIDLEELFQMSLLNLDYHFKEQSIEEALYSTYPDYFQKPQ